MIIDTSAIAAILFAEPDAGEFIDALARATDRRMSAATAAELMIVVERRLGDAGTRELDLLLHKAAIAIVPFDHEHAELARGAWRRFGKGRHAAALNLGDCFAYALSAATGLPLLYKGDDFAKTDVIPAL